MCRLKLALAVTILGAVGILATVPAGAVADSHVKDFEHPFVGLIVLYDESGEFYERCSGSLLTPQVFLTAAHCVQGATTARVYFQQNPGANYDPDTLTDAMTGYPDECGGNTLGTLCATSNEFYDNGYDNFAGFPDVREAAIVLLDQPIELQEYGQLVRPGELDGKMRGPQRRMLTFTSSGYGILTLNPVHVTLSRERLMSTSTFVSSRSAITDGYTLQLNGNGNGRGGTCTGDSGGPVFYGDTPSNAIISVTSFGLNAWCRGTDFSYRIDRQEIIDWIRSVVGTTEFEKIQFTAL